MNEKTAKRLRKEANEATIGMPKSATKSEYKKLKKIELRKPAQVVNDTRSKRQRRLAQ